MLLLKELLLLLKPSVEKVLLEGFFAMVLELFDGLSFCFCFFVCSFSGLIRSSKHLTLDKDVKDWDFPWKCFESPLLQY